MYLLAAVLSTTTAAPAWAVNDDAFASFGAGGGGFVYLIGNGGGGFPLNSGCPANTACLRTASATDPYVLKSTIGAFTSGTVSIPADALVLRPGASNSVQIGWIAPAAGFYQITAQFFRLDSVRNFAAISPFYSATQSGVQTVDPYTLLNPGAPSVTYSRQIALNAFGYFAFDINPATDGYAADSTGVRFTVTDAVAVPEMTTWGMMIAGFAAIGTLRRGRRRAGVTALR
jgi:hypothetical protein